MPCTRTGNLDGDRIEAMQEITNELTKLLCYAMRRIEANDVSFDMSAEPLAGELAAWWKLHQTSAGHERHTD